MITSQYFTISGTSSVFASGRHIGNKQHCSVWIQRINGSWYNLGYGEFDLVNNSIILNTPVIDTLVKKIEIRVADNQEELGTPVTDVSTVSGNIEQVNIVANNISNIVALMPLSDAITGLYDRATKIDSLYADKATLDSLYADKAKLDSIFADKAKLDSLYGDKTKLDSLYTDKATLDAIFSNLAKIGNVSDNITKVANLDTNMTKIANVDSNMTALAAINSNMAEILQADTNAQIATTKATEAQLSTWEAEARKRTADSYATEPEDVFVKVYTSNGDGTFTATDTTEYSAFHWKEKAQKIAVGTDIIYADYVRYDSSNSVYDMILAIGTTEDFEGALL